MIRAIVYIFVLWIVIALLIVAHGCAVGVHPVPARGGIDMHVWAATNSHSDPKALFPSTLPASP